MKISIFGLGYVGTVSLGCLVRDGHELIGVDIDQTKLDLIAQGHSPIIEEGMQALMADAANSGRVQVTPNAEESILNSDVSFICVGTPSQPNSSQNLNYIERVSEQIGTALKKKDAYHLVVIRSTVFPGTLNNIIKPILEKHSGKRCCEHFDLCFQPEFLREGSSIKDYDNPPYTIVGTDSERAAETMKEIFGHLPCPVYVTDIGSAEMLKYACNIFHALKITFANEIGRLAQSLSVDPHSVMDLVCKDKQLNISPVYMKPGFAYGGSCLPKDLKAMLYVAKSNDILVPMLQGIQPSNQEHIDHAINMVLATGKKNVGMIGLSFKTGTDDLRESPLVVMAERFIGKGLNLKIFDPEVHMSKLMGANRKYIEESIPHISSLLIEKCEDLLAQSEAIIIGLHNPSIVETLFEHTRDSHWLLDLVNVPYQDRLKGSYQGICW